MIFALLAATVLAANPVPPQSADYETIADLKGVFISGEGAWSSTGLLILEGPPGLCVFDPERPKEPPKPLGIRGSPRWSPEGDWLVVETGNTGFGTASDSHLIAIRL